MEDYFSDGRISPALGQGHVKLSHQLSLDNVLLVPRFPVSLSPVQRLCYSLNCKVNFTKTGCVFRNVTNQVELVLISRKDLYYLVMNKLVPTSFAAKSSQLSAQQYHNKLGHPRLHKLPVLFPRFNSLSSLN